MDHSTFLDVTIGLWSLAITYAIYIAWSLAEKNEEELKALRRDHDMVHNMCSSRHEVLVGVINDVTKKLECLVKDISNFYSMFEVRDNMQTQKNGEHIALKYELDLVKGRYADLVKEMMDINDRLSKKRPLFTGTLKVENYAPPKCLGNKRAVATSSAFKSARKKRKA